MRLLTILRDNGNDKGKHLVADDNWHHDAVLAHALIQAMREAGDGTCEVAFYADDDYQNWVYDRADELMRSWGLEP